MKNRVFRVLFIIWRIFRPYIIGKNKKFIPNDIDDVLCFCFGRFNGLIRPMQIREELKKLCEFFIKKSPKVILEIGTANGGTLFCFSKLATSDATIISIDFQGGMFGGGYPEWKIPIYQSFAKDGQEIHLMREDSHLSATLEKIKKILNNRQIDFLFIDGDHSYEGVKKDFEMYKYLVKKGGVIAFHDIAPNGKEELTGGTPRFWRETKNNYQYNEFVSDINQDGYGIGILFL